MNNRKTLRGAVITTLTATAALIVLNQVVVAAQSPNHGATPQKLQRWKTTDGHETEAMFYRVDPEAETVTLLVPKTIRIDRLDDASIELIETLSQPKDPEFVILNTLDDPTYAEWQAATHEQQVALTGALVFGIIHRGLASKKLRDAVEIASDLNPLALELYLQIELTVMMAREKNPSFDPSEIKVSEMALATTRAAGWLDEDRLPSSRETDAGAAGEADANGEHHIDGVTFSEIRLQRTGERFRLIGRIANTNDRAVQIGTYYFNFGDAEGLADVASLVVTNLKAGETQTFKVELFDFVAAPDMSTMTITPKAVVSLDQ